MLAQRGVERVLRVPGLHPHFAARGLRGVTPGSARGLHQQCEQPLRRAKVAAEQRAVGVHRRHQRDAPEVVPLGDHLRAHQHVYIARMHGAELLLQRALGTRAVRVDARNAGAGQQLGQLLFEPLGAAADGRDVEVAALGAGAGHTFSQAAVMAAQGPVQLVEHAPGAAVRAAALPAAVATVQHRRITATVQEHQALLLPLDSQLKRRQQRWRHHRAHALHLGQQPHVDQAHGRQCAAANARGQAQPQIAALVRALPAFKRRRGRTQQHRRRFELAAVHREVARRVAGPLLALERRVVLFVDDDQPEPRH